MTIATPTTSQRKATLRSSGDALPVASEYKQKANALAGQACWTLMRIASRSCSNADLTAVRLHEELRRRVNLWQTGGIVRWVLFVISTFGAAAVILSAGNSDDLPEGKGKAVLIRMCSDCHGLDQVTTSRYPKKQWAYVVDDMVSRGATGSDEDVNSVIGYLSRNFGKPININTSTAREIEAGLSFTAAQSELLVRYRTDKGAFKTYDDLLKVPGLDAEALEEQKKNILF
jgi:competence protein ComEA